MRKLLHYASKIFGVSYFDKVSGFWHFVDIAYFWVVFVWYAGCTVRHQLTLPGFYGQLFTLRMVVIFLCIQTLHLIPLGCIVKFRLSSRELGDLAALRDRLRGPDSATELPASRRRRRRVALTLVLLAAYVVTEVVFACWCLTAFDEGYQFFEFACQRTITCPVLMLVLQFLHWTLTYRHVFELSMRRLQAKMARSAAAESALREARSPILGDSSSEINDLMAFKLKIVRVYGMSVVCNQLIAFIGIIFNSCWFWYERETAPSVNEVWRLFFYFFMSIIPHWVGQMTLSKVSSRPLTVADVPTASTFQPDDLTSF